jgi:hypothetical protein
LTVNGIVGAFKSSSSCNGSSSTSHAGAPSSTSAARSGRSTSFKCSAMGPEGFDTSGVIQGANIEALAAAAAPGRIEGRPAAAAATAEVCLGPSNHAAGKKERWKRGSPAAAATARRMISSTDGPGGACVTCGVDAALCAEPCVVCWEALPEVVLLPCKHLVLCVGCSAQVAGVGGECPMCRAAVTEHMRVFRL